MQKELIDSFYELLSKEEKTAFKQRIEDENKPQPGETSALMKTYLEAKHKEAGQAAAMPGVSDAMKKYLKDKN